MLRRPVVSRLATALVLSCTVCSRSEPTSANSPPPQGPEPTAASADTPGEPPPAAWADVDALLRDLPTTLPATSRDGLQPLASRVAAVPGVSKAEARPGERPMLTIELARPIDAAHAVALLGWTDAHVISGDVHQTSWHVMVRTQDVEDPHGRRIAGRVPTYGEWELELQATARPEGPLPGVSAGASPAYPLDRYATTIERIFVQLPP
jgi:hypothetical protein